MGKFAKADATGVCATAGPGGGPHTHPISDVTNLQTTLDGKAASSHSHVIGDVTNLQSSLDGKASSSHTHNATDVNAGTLAFARLPAIHDTLMKPAFFNHANLTTVTAFATNTSYFVYLGRVATAITTLDVRCRVTAAAATITWAEVGVFTGTPVLAGNPSLTRRGFTNVATTFNSTGLKSTTVALTGVSAGDELWLAFGSQATTPFQVRGGLADDLQSGWYASVAGRISTLSVPVSVTLASATLVPPWCSAKL